MLALKSHVTNNNGTIGSSYQQQPPPPIKSWTTKPVKSSGEKSRQNEAVHSPRALYGRGKIQGTDKLNIGGEWTLKECEEHTVWLNGILKKHKSRPINDLRKSISDGLTLVNTLEILFNSKIQGVQTRPIIRAQRLENIHLCLRFLENRGVEIQHISADELVDGNLRSILALVTCLRKRFEAFHTSSGNHGDGSFDAKSTPRSLPTEDGIQPPLGREASVNSFHRQQSIHSQHSDGFPTRSKSSEAPATIPSDEDELTCLTSATTSAPFNGGEVGLILPGTLADSDDDDGSGGESPDKRQNVVAMSMTELDSTGVSQHGVNGRKRLPGSHKRAFRPRAVKQNSLPAGSGDVSTNVPRDVLALSLEERLKNLLDNPTSGQRHVPPEDDHEILELPPPRQPSYHGDDDDDNGDDDGSNTREMTVDANKLQTMLEDPDNFDDYPKDWDRYVSGYVPSHSAEKAEGPRAQRLLDRQTDMSQQPPIPKQRTLPFFHAPPSQHMGPIHGPPPVNGQGQYINGLHSLPNKDPNDNGVMYSDGIMRNHTFGGANFHAQPQYHHSNESPILRRQLPSYNDHIQRHPPKPRVPHPVGDAMYAAPDRSMPLNHPMLQGYPQDWPTQQPRHSDNQYDRWDYEQREFEQVGEDHRQGRSFLNHMHDDGIPQKHPPVPMLDLSRRQEYRYDDGPNQHPSYPYRDRQRKSSNPRTKGYNGGPSVFHYGQLGGSSTGSSTPPLPLLSPDNSDSESSVHSPEAVKKTQRSVSVGVLPSGLRVPMVRLNEPPMGTKKRRSSGRTNAVKTLDPKSPSRKSAGKGRRKMKLVKSNSHTPVTTETTNRRKTKNGRALPPSPLRKVPEHSDRTDSDRSSHRSHGANRDSSDSQASTFGPGSPSRLPTGRPLAGRSTAEQPDDIREQLVSLEKMYLEILEVISNERKDQSQPENRGDKQSISSLSTTTSAGRAPVGNKTKVPQAKVSKRRDKDIKLVNRRFARVESHVVTLARSVAHLSSELRSQSAMYHEIEDLHREMNQIRDTQVLNANDVLTGGGMKFRPIVPLCSDPRRIKKLTKFFGEEPPLLTMFLQDLGYEKYISLFESEGIGMVELPYLSEEGLASLGLPTGPRLRILQEAQLMV